MSGSDESALIARAKAGDGDALDALFRAYGEKLRARVRRHASPLILRKVSAGDILQEAYLVAHRRIGEFEDRGEGSFGAWLIRIVDLKMREAVRRYALTDKRGAHAEVSRDARASTAAVAARQPTPSAMAMGAEMEERVRLALEKLPDDYREVIRLVQRDGLTMAEAAARLGRSAGATKMLYGRALSRFADLLGVEGRGRP